MRASTLPTTENEVFLRQVLRIYRNAVVAFMRNRFRAALGHRAEAELASLFAKADPQTGLTQWERMRRNAELARVAPEISTTVTDSFELLGVADFYSVFEKFFDIIFPKYASPDHVRKNYREGILRCARQIKVLRDPNSHEVSEDIESDAVFLSIDNAVIVLQACDSQREAIRLRELRHSVIYNATQLAAKTAINVGLQDVMDNSRRDTVNAGEAGRTIYVTEPRKHIRVVISHSAQDADEAKRCQEVLSNAGFTTFRCTHGAAELQNRDTIRTEIEKCHFFVLLASTFSEENDGVRRDLALARAIREQSDGYRPIVIAVYGTENRSSGAGRRLQHFPTRDFDTGAELTPLNLDAIRCIDRYSNPDVDGDELLLSYMRPTVWVSKHNFEDEAWFDDTGVFELYGKLFPKREQDSPADIKRWVLRADLGQTKPIDVIGEVGLQYNLDSRYFILTVAHQAIGLAFFTYDAFSAIMYGNYIAIAESWRAGALANLFVNKIVEILRTLFPDYRGIVFEVEKIDRDKLEHALRQIEIADDREQLRQDDRDEFSKALRVIWYDSIDATFFVDRESKEPMICRSPCLDPEKDREQWESEEADYWLMWYKRPGTGHKAGSKKELWIEVVNCVYIEILAKSLVEAYSSSADEYWRYAQKIVSETTVKDGDVEFGRYFRRDDPLMARIMKLRRGMPV